MFVWFAVLAVVAAWMIFQSPALDYRLVALGAVVPLADAFTGGPWVLHTLVASAAGLAVVMGLTRRRRLVRRRLLGVPIGMFMHLVLDFTWADTDVFWWPFFGMSFEGEGLVEWSRGWAGVALEVVGVAVLVWFTRAAGLDAPAARRRFVRTGQLPR